MIFAFQILSCFVGLLPILSYQGFLDSVEFPRLVFFYITIVLVIILTLTRLLDIKRSYQVKIDLFDSLLLLLLLFIGLSTLFSANPDLGFWGRYPKANQSLIFWLGLASLIFLTKQVNNSKQFLNYPILGLFISGLYGIYQYFSQGFYQTSLEFRANGFETSPTFFGIHMAIGFILALSMESSTSFKKISKLITLVGFFLALILSFSRGAEVSFLMALLILGWFGYRSKLRFNRVHLFRPVVGLLIILLILLSPLVLRSISPLVDFDSPFTSQHIRLLELESGVKLALAKSWPLGIGPGQLDYYFPQYRSTLYNQTQEWQKYPEQIRNNYLNFLITFGPLNTILFIGLISLVIGVSYQQLTTKLNSNYLFLFGAWVCLTIYGLFYYYDLLLWVYFWILTVFLIKAWRFKPILKIRVNTYITTLFMGISILGLVFSLRVIYKVILAELKFGQGMKAFSQLSFFNKNGFNPDTNILFVDYQFNTQDLAVSDQTLSYFSQANQIAPYPNDTYLRYQLIALGLKGRLTSLKFDKSIAFNQALTLSNQNLAAHPLDSLALRTQSTIEYRMALEGIDPTMYFDQAISDNQKILQLDPSNPTRFDNFGLLLRDANKIDSAISLFQQALNLKPDYIPPYIHLGECYERKNQPDKALDTYEQALKVDPQNQLVLDKITKIKSAVNGD